MGIRRSRKRGTEEVPERTAALKERLAPVIDRSRQAAEEATDTARSWAGPRVHAARSWAGPHLEKGINRGREAAAPAGEHLGPVVDSARERLVEDLIPRIVAAVSAGVAAATNIRAAADRSDGQPTADTDTDTPEPTTRRCCGARSRRCCGARPSRALLVLAVVAAVVTAVAMLLRSRRDAAGGQDGSTPDIPPIWTEEDLIPPAAGSMAGTSDRSPGSAPDEVDPTATEVAAGGQGPEAVVDEGTPPAPGPDGEYRPGT